MSRDSHHITVPTWSVSAACAIGGAIVTAFIALGTSSVRGDEKSKNFELRVAALETKIDALANYAPRMAVTESRQDETVRRLASIEASLDKLVEVIMAQRIKPASRK